MSLEFCSESSITYSFRSHSPKTKNTQVRDDSSKSAYDINYLTKQVHHSLTHFKDVIAKNKLEMLSGNGTIVLETIANVHSALKAQKLNNTHNSAIISGKCFEYFLLNLNPQIKL